MSRPPTLRGVGERRPAGLALRCRGVAHRYRTHAGEEVAALRAVELDIEAGERVALVGPSGSGKSTLLSLLGGVQRPTTGRIWLGNDEVSQMDEKALSRLRRGRVSTMLQGAMRNLLPYATAGHNLRFAAAASSAPRSLQAWSDEQGLLREVGLTGQAHQAVATMSGGQRQRLALACAVVSSPSVLLADEPTSQLGRQDRDDVLRLVHRLADRYGMTVLVITHEPAVAETFARSLHLQDGVLGRTDGKLGG